MHTVTRMTEVEGIAYRRGFNDGLAAVREKVKELLLETALLREPILGPLHLAASVPNPTEPLISGEDLEAWLSQPGRPLVRFASKLDDGCNPDALDLETDETSK